MDTPDTMTCPKCGFEQERFDECVKCGVIISKYLNLKEDQGGAKESVADVSPVASGRGTRLKRIVQIALVVNMLLLALSIVMKNRLPGKEAMLKQLRRQPIQLPTDTGAFTRKVKDVRYLIVPLYSYELYGMIVSYHHSGSWWDMYHHQLWGDYVNVKDICVIWGPNILTEVYRQMKFSSDTWTCFASTETQEAWYQFYPTCLSNNHLLSSDRRLNKEIMRARKGDQVYLRGYLAEYSHAGGFQRGTSTSRTDTGNGACETIWLEEFKILRRANVLWNFLYAASKYGIILCLIALISLFVKQPARVE
ncbi:hypothetical protein ACFL0Q_06165 [Thermodesulfobacteriota bacterium]